MRHFVIFVLVWLSVGLVRAEDFAPWVPKSPLELDNPARPWGEPSDMKPIRALVITPWAASRDAYVVAQHMPFEFEIVQARDSVEIKLEVNKPWLLAHLPYRIGDLSVEVTDTVCAGQERGVRLTVRGAYKPTSLLRTLCEAAP